MKKEKNFAGIEARMEKKIVRMTREERAIWSFVQRFYGAARKETGRIEYFRFFREHYRLHILLVWSRTKAQACQVACALNKSEQGYAGCADVDLLTIEAAALFHDCGMGFVAKENADDGDAIRRQHAMRSAMAVCREDSYTFLCSLGVCPETVATVSLLHSKSCSGVADLSSDGEIRRAIDRLAEKVAREGAGYTFNKGIALMQVRIIRTYAAVLRMADGAGHDADSAVTMGGEEIVVTHDGGTSRVYVGGREVYDNLGYLLGEANIRRMWLNVEAGVVIFDAVVVDPSLDGKATQFALKERIGEMQTIRGAAVLFRVTGEKKAAPEDASAYAEWAAKMEKDLGVPVEVGFIIDGSGGA